VDIDVPSAVEVFTTLRYINVHLLTYFTYLLTRLYECTCTYTRGRGASNSCNSWLLQLMLRSSVGLGFVGKIGFEYSATEVFKYSNNIYSKYLINITLFINPCNSLSQQLGSLKLNDVTQKNVSVFFLQCTMKLHYHYCNQTVNERVAYSKNPRKCAYHVVTFDLDVDLEHILDAR